MRPINTELCNVIYTHAECAPLPAKKNDTVITTFWKPSEAERAMIARGGVVVLQILAQNPQPVAISASDNDLKEIAIPADTLNAHWYNELAVRQNLKDVQETVN